ncbi:MAG: PAS domain S-box protein [Desulfobacterales bacterium]|nr:PAS domain S-box protein [Desulfobacterales bacterium]
MLINLIISGMIRQNETPNQDLLSELDKLRLEIDSEKQFRLITEIMPMPIIISRVSDGVFVYANKSAGSMFGLSIDKLTGKKLSDFYEPADMKPLMNSLGKRGRVSNFELQGKKAGGGPCWTDLSVRSLTFNNEPCYLCAFYDMTDRILEEEEIFKLKQELEEMKRYREGKYLTFTLENVIYGIKVQKIREIIKMMPVRSVPQAPGFVKGVINLRGRVIPVMDLRLRFGVEAKNSTDRTCIIVVVLERKKGRDRIKKEIGIAVDSVSDVLKISNEDIEDAPKIGIGLNTDYILGMAMLEGGVKILLDIDKILNTGEIKALDLGKDMFRDEQLA